ncbi:MAG: hypothetical protein HXX19_09640 [Rhodoferax sp.]|nr:hypothetical protein [Rhodoferax sp.]
MLKSFMRLRSVAGQQHGWNTLRLPPPQAQPQGLGHEVDHLVEQRMAFAQRIKHHIESMGWNLCIAGSQFFPLPTFNCPMEKRVQSHFCALSDRR